MGARGVGELGDLAIGLEAIEGEFGGGGVFGFDDGLVAFFGALVPFGAVLGFGRPGPGGFLEAAALAAFAADGGVGDAVADGAGEDLGDVGIGPEGEARVGLARGEEGAFEELLPLVGGPAGLAFGGDPAAGALPELEERAGAEAVAELAGHGVLSLVGTGRRGLGNDFTIL